MFVTHFGINITKKSCNRIHCLILLQLRFPAFHRWYHSINRCALSIYQILPFPFLNDVSHILHSEYWDSSIFRIVHGNLVIYAILVVSAFSNSNSRFIRQLSQKTETMIFPAEVLFSFRFQQIPGLLIRSSLRSSEIFFLYLQYMESCMRKQSFFVIFLCI